MRYLTCLVGDTFFSVKGQIINILGFADHTVFLINKYSTPQTIPKQMSMARF